MPVKTEMTVISADEPNQLKIGWIVKEYTGCEVYYVIDGKIQKDVIKEPLHENMEVSAWGGIWTVKFNNKSPYLDSPRTIGTLVFNEDDRECWVCSCLINKRCISPPKKISIVE